MKRAFQLTQIRSFIFHNKTFTKISNKQLNRNNILCTKQIHQPHRKTRTLPLYNEVILSKGLKETFHQ